MDVDMTHAHLSTCARISKSNHDSEHARCTRLLLPVHMVVYVMMLLGVIFPGVDTNNECGSLLVLDASGDDCGWEEGAVQQETETTR